MTADSLFQVTDAMRARLESVLGDGEVYVGPPDGDDVGERRASLFLFHIDPNRDLRNTPFLATPVDPNEPLEERPAHPVDLRYLISVFRAAGNGGLADANELNTLGLIMQELRRSPDLVGPAIDDQAVRITHEPYPMEEMSRVWGLFPQTFYRTSVVYLVSPVFITLESPIAGPRVVERTLNAGIVNPSVATREVSGEVLDGVVS